MKYASLSEKHLIYKTTGQRDVGQEIRGQKKKKKTRWRLSSNYKKVLNRIDIK